MTVEELRQIVREVVTEMMTNGELAERTVASRTPPRKMTPAQVVKRDGIGKKMKEKPAAVKYFKKKFGDDWEYYLWAVATNRAIDGGKEK